MTETPEARLKRMKMRSWRRGTKEMDLILGPFADHSLTQMSDQDLQDFDQVLEENDQDLYPWVTGKQPPPAHLAPMLARISAFALGR